MEDENTTTNKYYEMTEEQAAAIKTLLDNFGVFVKENYAALMGAKDALVTPADVIPDTRDEEREYRVEVSMEEPDVMMEINVNDHLDSYAIDNYALKDAVEGDVGIRPASVEVAEANFDYYSDVDVTAIAYFSFTAHITVPSKTENYCDEVQEMLYEHVKEIAPDIANRSYTIHDYSFECVVAKTPLADAFADAQKAAE